MEAAAAARVVLLGDSTLDNVVWVDEPAQAVPAALTRSLDAAVINLAADGFTSADMLEGAPPNISHAARSAAGDPFPTASGEPFFPLPALLDLSPAPTHLVLSVGGNDVREILGAMHELPARIAAFHSNYPLIAEACEASGARVIVMLQYRPDLATDLKHYGVYRAIDAGIPGGGDRVAKLNQLMQGIYPPVLALALAKGWDVLDLPNTFDIHCSELYRCQIEPSPRGGALIAELIAHAVTKRPDGAPGTRQAMLISKPVGGSEIVETPLVASEELGSLPPELGAVCPASWRITEPSAAPTPAPAPVTAAVAAAPATNSDDESGAYFSHFSVYFLSQALMILFRFGFTLLTFDGTLMAARRRGRWTATDYISALPRL